MTFSSKGADLHYRAATAHHWHGVQTNAAAGVSEFDRDISANTDSMLVADSYVGGEILIRKDHGLQELRMQVMRPGLWTDTINVVAHSFQLGMTPSTWDWILYSAQDFHLIVEAIAES
jgi:hypothetical protein